MVVQPIIIDREPDQEVDRILHHCIVRKIILYLAFFVGFDISGAVQLSADDLSKTQMYYINTGVYAELGTRLAFWQFYVVLQGTMLVVIRYQFFVYKRGAALLPPQCFARIGFKYKVPGGDKWVAQRAFILGFRLVIYTYAFDWG